MAAIALYCAASVYIYQCKKTQSPKNIGNLEFIIAAMDAIGREHIITRAFLKQLLLDIERNDITQIRTSRTRPAVNGLPHVIAVGNHNIPLLMRSQISRHTELPTPLPGRLPLGNPKGDINLHPKCNINLNQMSDCGIGDGSPIRDNPLGSGSDASRREGGSPLSSAAAASGASNLSQEQIPFCTPSSHEHSPLWCPNDTTRPSNLTPPDAATRSQPPSQPVRADPFASFQRSPWAQLTRGFTNKPIPVRTGSPMVTTPISAQSRGPTLPGSPAIPVSRIAEPQHPSPYISPNLDRDFAPADVCMYGQLANEPALASGNSGDPWDISGQAESVDWDALGTTSADIVVADFPNSLHVDLNR